MVAGVSLWTRSGQEPNADGFVEDLFTHRENNRKFDRTKRFEK